MHDSGVVDVWAKSGILGVNAAERVMDGKGYARSKSSDVSAFDDVVVRLLSPGFSELMDTFLRATHEENPTLQFW